MKISEAEANRVWESMVEAEVRSLYFADLASSYTKQKQIITGISLFLSSGAAATILSNAVQLWVPLVFSAVTAMLTAYSIAVGLDKKIAALVKLHSAWNNLKAGYEDLWFRWHEDSAAERLKDLRKKEQEASEAGLEMPYIPKRLQKWQDMTFERYKHAA